MSDEQTETRQIGRRKLLALAGTAAAVFSGGSSVLLSQLRSETESGSENGESGSENGESESENGESGSENGESESENGESESENGESEQIEIDAENIRDYGAEPNPDDPDEDIAQANLNAILEAATAAGNGGAIYVPAGTYHVGQSSDRTVLTDFGGYQPAGISVYGEGPAQSSLVISEHRTDDRGHTLFRYDEVPHGAVEFKNITLDGNQKNLGNLQSQGTGSRAVSASGDESTRFEFDNVYFRQWYTGALRLRHVPASLENCTFEENAIQVHLDSNGEFSGQHITNRPRSGDETIIRKCYFTRCSGAAINFSDNTGTMIVEDCYVEGAGSGVVKLSADGTLALRNCYLQPNTAWLEENLPNPDRRFPQHGRHIIKKLRGEVAGESAAVIMDNVECRDITLWAIGTRHEDIDPFVGDMISIKNVATNNQITDAIRGRRGAGFKNVDINRISIHNTSNGNGLPFDLSNSDGKIETLHRDSVSRGNLSGVTVNTDRLGGDPFEPDVPSKDDVGCIDTV